MFRLLLVAALIGGGLYFRNRLRRLPPDRRRQLWWRAITALILGAALLLVATGRLHWLAAALAALLPLLRLVLRFGLPWLVQHLGRRNAPSREPGGRGRSDRHHAGDGTRMTRLEALAALGLADGATREEIIAAHRRLIQRVHPDRGGSDYLAARINLAKETLLTGAP